MKKANLDISLKLEGDEILSLSEDFVLIHVRDHESEVYGKVSCGQMLQSVSALVEAAAEQISGLPKLQRFVALEMLEEAINSAVK